METQSDWSRHWDTLCLGVITLATAALGVAIFGVDFSELAGKSAVAISWVSLVSTFGISFAIVVYALVVGTGLLPVFFFNGSHFRDVDNKRRVTSIVYVLFLLQVFAVGVVMIANIWAGPTPQVDPDNDRPADAGPTGANEWTRKDTYILTSILRSDTVSDSGCSIPTMNNARETKEWNGSWYEKAQQTYNDRLGGTRSINCYNSEFVSWDLPYMTRPSYRYLPANATKCASQERNTRSTPIIVRSTPNVLPA